jgi:hypothetical protein
VTDDEMSAIRGRLAASTPGPWEASMRTVWDVTGSKAIADIPPHVLTEPDEREANAVLIANAPSDLAALLARVDDLKAENDQLRPLLDLLQDSDPALAAARLERARCVAMVDKMRRREEAKVKERGGVGDDWLNGRINALNSLAQRMEDAP